MEKIEEGLRGLIFSMILRSFKQKPLMGCRKIIVLLSIEVVILCTLEGSRLEKLRNF